MQIKIINHSDNPLPSYATEDSAGMDLRAFITEPVILKPSQRTLIPTGISIELPKGYEAQIRPRSGLAARNGVVAIFGTIDSDYRGVLQVLLVNLSTEDFVVQNGERIAQVVIAKYEKVEWALSAELSQTERGTGGFGSTGIQ